MTQEPKKLELLSPARDLVCGLAAINHGADAVYIGANRFGARKGAGNSLEDIATLIKHAHLYGARVYVALNTLLYDHELEDAEKLIREVYNLGADAVIVQDMAILEMNLPPIPLHASTQTDNRTPAKVQFLEDAGFQQVVLARELSLEEIREIRRQTTLPLEFFVHGALCVSYSGKCFMSHACNGRSANRGECSQPCRLPYSLQTSQGEVLVKDRHLLSLKDLNLSDRLGDLIDAGITSFKIEGRLKDPEYVKNVTAHYRKILDGIILANPNLQRSSSGFIQSGFTPAPEKSFSRGFSTYFLDGRQKGIWSMHTPKSLGEKIGKVVKTEKDHFIIQTDLTLSNGDGLCYFDRQMHLTGLKADVVNGSKIYSNTLVSLYAGATIYRNYDHAFNKELENHPNERKIGIHLLFSETDDGVRCTLRDEDGHTTTQETTIPKEVAQKPEKALEQIKSQLMKWGNSPYAPISIKIDLTRPLFIPVSVVNTIRRNMGEAHQQTRLQNYVREEYQIVPTTHPYPEPLDTHESNVLNHLARAFYQAHGVNTIDPGFELGSSDGPKRVMTTRHCIRFATELCPRENPQAKSEDLVMKSGKNSYLLKFDCKKCEMQVFVEK
jgi:23S rRNA 5-hydroxycytidine C2501 synthase